MPDQPLTNRLLNFFTDHVQSIERLEILCILAENPAKSWSVNEVFRHVQSTEKSVGDCLQHFAIHNLAAIDSNNCFQFPSRTSEETKAAVDLVRTYRERRVAVIEAIYAKRADGIQGFADAFRPRKKK